MRWLGVVGLAVALAGCTGAGAADTQISPPRAHVHPAVAELEKQLAAVEARLAKADDPALRQERLVLSIALVELERRLAAGGKAPDEKALLGEAARTVELERERLRAAATPPKQGGKRPPRELHQLDDLPAAGAVEDKARDEGEAQPHGKIEKARVEGDPSRPAALMSAVEGKLPAMEACLGDLDDDVEIQVMVRLDTGVVKDPRVTGVAAEPAGCIGDVLRTVRVPEHKRGSQIVRFPLFFAAK